MSYFSYHVRALVANSWSEGYMSSSVLHKGIEFIENIEPDQFYVLVASPFQTCTIMVKLMVIQYVGLMSEFDISFSLSIRHKSKLKAGRLWLILLQMKALLKNIIGKVSKSCKYNQYNLLTVVVISLHTLLQNMYVMAALSSNDFCSFFCVQMSDTCTTLSPKHS